MTKEALEKTKAQGIWSSIFDDVAHLSPMAKRETLVRRVDKIARQNGYDNPSVRPRKYAEYMRIRELVRRFS